MAVKKLKKKKSNTIKVTKEQPRVYLEDKLWYKMKFVDHKIEEGKYGEYIQLVFEILKGDDEDGNDAKGKKIFAITNADINPTSDLWGFMEVIMGRAPKIDEEIDVSAYYGNKVQGFVEDNKKKKKTDTRYQNVVELKSYDGKKKKKKTKK